MSAASCDRLFAKKCVDVLGNARREFPVRRVARIVVMDRLVTRQQASEGILRLNPENAVVRAPQDKGGNGNGRRAALRLIEQAAERAPPSSDAHLAGYASLSNYTALGGVLTVFTLP